ncbi:V-set domain-containing T-cell activation inhibitor 1-like isoform X2 [Hemibagrus wyckioides]|uniref:V-set domain-containing T-cell activation inhibitor 1-like isoform X2 n=1 Tax=Hemibagrus wyckioides TaxID=337641 RepID=UPI00266C81BB|nr:V-set domain-containing T-cell activation inhibitor 1-like isoform X2 [Hemibagrus wyckioides]
MQLFSKSNKSVLHTLFKIYTLLWTHSCGQNKIPDVHVTCIYSEDCILPCTFPPSTEEVVFQWYKQGTLIYSLLENGDESVNNISVFTDEVSHGNASLHLQFSSVKSRGRYKCVVNTTKAILESHVIVKIEAPIHGIAIGVSPTEHLHCSSTGVYPAPLLIWSTEPRSASTSLQAVTRMRADSNDLYSIDSTLKKMCTNSNLTYICSITSKYSSQSWKASLLQTEMSLNNGQNLVIPCMAPKNLKNFTLTWTFLSMNTQTDILTYYSQTQRIKNHWDDQAELDLNKALMGDGSLYLNNLGSKPSRTYACTFTGSQVKHIVQTLVKANASKAVLQTGNSGSKLWVLAIIVAALVLLCVSFYIYRKCQGKSKDSWQDHQDDTEMQAMHRVNSVEELQAECKPHAEHNKDDSLAREKGKSNIM